MKLVCGAWKILVGIKDGLVLIFMLLFFGFLFALFSSKPNASVRDGALVLKLDGAIVEQPETPTALGAAQGNGPSRQYRLRDILRALDAAKTDDRVKVVVLDLDGYGGGYPAAVTEVANKIAEVKKTKKVLAYATAYMDGSYLLASNASEIWVNPMGGALFSGPGGNSLYYKGLIDKLGVNVHVYRVGKFKSYVEPYTRDSQSPEAKEASTALYGAIFGQWKDLIHKARPKAQIDQFLSATPEAPIVATKGDLAQAGLNAGLVDKLGDRIAFGKYVASIAGEGPKKIPGSFATIKYADWLAANPPKRSGDKIGVVTVAGEIVDGKAPSGTAGGDTIATAVLDALSKKELKALVVRIDSPGGSALASETIRKAVLEAKGQKLPVVVSMGGLAASGGYWVATSGDVIFAEPNTITGSIGIFGIIPTFENSLKKLGITPDGVKTTPLSGQPDVYGGTTPQVDTILQASIEHGYAQFISRVAAARKMTPERVDEIGQGRVWDGGTARQLGLVDRFGTLDDAIAEAAKRAGLDPKNVQAVYLEKQPGWFAKLIQGWARDDDSADSGDSADGDVFAMLARSRTDMFARALGDAKRLAVAGSVQARCLECVGFSDQKASEGDKTLLQIVMKAIWK